DNRFDVERMIRERRIVIINLASLGELSGFLSNTIGAMALNEIFETAFRMSTVFGRHTVDPTFVVLDEFQRFANSPDIMAAIPTVRQVGLKLVLAHQSFSQLKQGDLDLTEIIWQAQNRFAFANSAEDADIIANELAVMSFDSTKIKYQTQIVRQRVAGHRIEWLESQGINNNYSKGFSEQNMIGYGHSAGLTASSEFDRKTISSSTSENRGNTAGQSEANTTGRSESRSQTLVPILEDVTDISGVQFKSFEEHRLEWMKIIRQLKTGRCFGKFVDDDHLYHLLVDYVRPKKLLRMQERIAELKQRNYEQDFFVSSSEADRLMEQARQQLLQRPRVTITEPATFQSASDVDGNCADAAASEPPSPSPFRRPRKKD
ncbi:MAG TPA: type IV secretory system conjugative DNA transfer family protein, partial [Planctomycetaceae bacterium]|nr:type IV secretory system conjugative DNA transfer family protein [Planctomycetaceae bacterium]